MSDIKKLQKKLAEFTEARDWNKYHTAKELAVSLNVEAGELLEKFLWQRGADPKYIAEHKEEIGEEMADVFIYLIMLADEMKVDLIAAADKKIKKNAKKYPIEKVKGSDKKYSDYE
ncbi:nucleotide pyrophosphohydrolase [Patescibacteria group bacterium]